MERLRKEALDFAGAIDRQFVVRRKLVHAEDGDDILEVLVALEHVLHAPGHLVVLLADDFCGQRLRCRGERVHRRIDAELSDRALEHDRGVEVGERVCRSRVGEIVRRHIDRLERGDRALGRGSDPLLKVAHFCGKRRLVSDGARRAAEKRRHLGARLGKPENVVDEEQDVLVLLIAEIFGHRERAERHAQTRPGRLVHLAVNQRDFGFFELGLVDDAGLAHLGIEVVSLAGALAHAGKHGVSAVAFGDVVDELHDDDRLADARAAERADFPALRERADQVDDFDPGLEDLRLGILLDERRCLAVDRVFFFELHRPALVGGIAGHVENPAQHTLADRNRNRGSGIEDFHAARKPFRRAHGDRAHPVFSEVLLDFEREAVRAAGGLERDFQGVVDLWQGTLGRVEFDVHNGADHLNDFSFVTHGNWFAVSGAREPRLLPVTHVIDNRIFPQ